MFAKLYETKEHGRILVKMDTNNDDNPEVRYYFEPEGLGVCSVAVGFKDNDKGYDLQEKVFKEVTEESAVEMVSKTKAECGL